ncbi:DUF2026 family protein [Candidatus Reidiella endopervernicosa]|uniref:DUF2026 family protein n=1 Tax=Candidatus Reidiella endopervernicosa TaxID=2738883 RepID=A0A6N0HZA1_9GAMM|nr:DUF2026 family protein [Candidatus Reidiella endopervernicosa]
MKDYERIYKTINAIILNEGADPTVSCTFFCILWRKDTERSLQDRCKSSRWFMLLPSGQ